MTDSTRLILLGKIVAAHGIRGDIKLISYTEDPLAITDYPLQTKQGNAITLKNLKPAAKDAIIAQIDGVNSRNKAEELRGTEFYTTRDQFDEIDDEDDFFIEDLVGLKIIHADSQKEYGHVQAMHNFGAGDLLEVAITGTKKTEVLPFTKAIFPNIDTANGTVSFSAPEVIIARDSKEGRPDDTAE